MEKGNSSFKEEIKEMTNKLLGIIIAMLCIIKADLVSTDVLGVLWSISSGVIILMVLFYSVRQDDK